MVGLKAVQHGAGAIFRTVFGGVLVLGLTTIACGLRPPVRGAFPEPRDEPGSTTYSRICSICTAASVAMAVVAATYLLAFQIMPMVGPALSR